MGPQTAAANSIHSMKYRGDGETFEQAISRISKGLQDDDRHGAELKEILLDQRFMPAGRIQAAIGSNRNVTAFNCYVAPTIEDAFVDGENCIMDVARKAAATMRMGGGIGYDFSSLRPRGAPVKRLESVSSGPVSFMHIFDAICLATASSGHRRGAQMGVMRIDHPDAYEFLTEKHNQDKLRGFNVSLAVTDEFMEAVDAGKSFDLRWGGKVYKTIDAAEMWEQVMLSTWDWAEPGVIFIDTVNRFNNLYYCEKIAATNPCVSGDTPILTSTGYVKICDLVGKKTSIWNGEEWSAVEPFSTGFNETVVVRLSDGKSLRCTPYHEWLVLNEHGSEIRVKAIDLQPSMELAKYGMPDAPRAITDDESDFVLVISVDDAEPCETFCFTEPLANRGTFNGIVTGQCGEQPLPPNGACLLGSFNLAKYLVKNGAAYSFDLARLNNDIPAIVRAMDNVTDRTVYPLPEQKQEALSKRRMGLGITGLANAAEALGHRYGSAAFLNFETTVLTDIKIGCYAASIKLAQEKGAFPLYDRDKYLAGKFIEAMPEEIRDGIARHGMRNSHLTSIAPTGTISMCADNVSSGLEPTFSYSVTRPVNTPSGREVMTIDDYGYKFLGIKGTLAAGVTADEHVQVLIAAQKQVDSAVSKTCNVRGNMPWGDFKNIYRKAWEGGCKGATTFNADGKRMALLTDSGPSESEGETCRIDAETGRRECS